MNIFPSDFLFPYRSQCAPKERRRGRAEKRLSKRVFLESPFFFSAPLRSALKTPQGPENLKGAEKKRTLQKHPFGQPFLRTTPSPLLWRALKKPLSPTPPRPHPTPRNGPETDPKQTRNGAKWSRTEPNRAEMDRNQALSGGTAGKFVRMGGVGGL